MFYDSILTVPGYVLWLTSTATTMMMIMTMMVLIRMMLILMMLMKMMIVASESAQIWLSGGSMTAPSWLQVDLKLAPS